MGQGAELMSVWDEIRSDYPAALRHAYLDTACKGIPPSVAEAAIASHVRRLRDSPGDSVTGETLVMLEQLDRARSAAARLIGAGEGGIALVPSTGEGLTSLAAGLRLDRAANVVVSDLEFAGCVLPWRCAGHEVKFVPHRDGAIDLADLDAAIDRRTAAVVISSVQEVNGFRVDLEELASICRRRDVLVIVDAIQHVGRLPLDVVATTVDAVAVGGHKWLCAPFGMGFLYAGERILERLDPPFRALMTAISPGGGWSPYLESPDRHPADELRFPEDARALEAGALGTTLAAAGLAASIERLLEIGPAEIAARSGLLLDRARSGLEASGAHIVTPAGSAPSSMVTFSTSANLDDERRLVSDLAAASVLTSLRGTTGVAGIRVSPYLYNDEDDIDRLTAVVESHLSRRR